MNSHSIERDPIAGVDLYLPSSSSVGSRSSSSGFFHACYPGEPEDEISAREQAYQTACQRLSCTMHTILQDANQQCFQSICDFLLQQNSTQSESHIESVPSRIPAALLFCGANLRFRESWCVPLRAKLDRLYPFVSEISPPNTSSGAVGSGNTSTRVSSSKVTPAAVVKRVLEQVLRAQERRELDREWVTRQLRKRPGLRFEGLDLQQPLSAVKMSNLSNRSCRELLVETDEYLSSVAHGSDGLEIFVEELVKRECESIEVEEFGGGGMGEEAEMRRMESRVQALERRVQEVASCVSYFSAAQRVCERLLLHALEVYIRRVTDWISRVDAKDEDGMLLPSGTRVVHKQSTRTYETRKRSVARAQVRRRDLLTLYSENHNYSGKHHTFTRAQYVVLLHQFDSLEGDVLRDVLTIFRENSRFGVALVAGLSSAVSPAFRNVPASISSAWNVQTFELVHGARCLDSVLHALVVSRASRLPVVLSGHVLRWLVHEEFAAFRLSMTALRDELQWVLASYFRRTPFSFLSVQCSTRNGPNSETYSISSSIQMGPNAPSQHLAAWRSELRNLLNKNGSRWKHAVDFFLKTNHNDEDDVDDVDSTAKVHSVSNALLERWKQTEIDETTTQDSVDDATSNEIMGQMEPFLVFQETFEPAVSMLNVLLQAGGLTTTPTTPTTPTTTTTTISTTTNSITKSSIGDVPQVARRTELVLSILTGSFLGSSFHYEAKKIIEERAVHTLAKVVDAWRSILLQTSFCTEEATRAAAAIDEECEHLHCTLLFVSSSSCSKVDDSTADVELTLMLPHIRNDMLHILENSVVGRLLPPFRTLPFHELFSFSDVESLRDRFHATNVTDLQHSLETPLDILSDNANDKKKKQRGDTQHVDGFAMDMALAYRIYKEQGRFLNLVDWYDRFKADNEELYTDADQCRESKKAKSSKSKSRVDDERVVKTRFLRCLCTLESMGFIRPYGKKGISCEKLVFL